METENDNVGTFEDPRDYSARWLARHAWEDRRIRSPNLAASWLLLEAGQGKIGNAGARYTARWIGREAWDAGLREPVIVHWTLLETSQKEFGNAGTPYTARWLARRRWSEGERRSLLHWIQLEFAAGNYGEIGGTEEFSARWFARQPWAEGLKTYPVVENCMKVERWLKKFGDPVAPAPYTARWFAREAWHTPQVNRLNLAVYWMVLEAAEGNLGNFGTRYSARWIAHEVWRTGVRDFRFFGAWVSIELRAKNFGDMLKPEEFSARWLIRNEWNSGQRDGPVLNRMALVEVVAPAAHRSNTLEIFSLDWIADRLHLSVDALVRRKRDAHDASLAEFNEERSAGCWVDYAPDCIAESSAPSLR